MFHNYNSALTFYSSHRAPNDAVILCLNAYNHCTCLKWNWHINKDQ